MTIFEGDRGLLTAFRAGQRDALRRIYVAYFDDVLAFFTRGFTLVGPPPARVPGLPQEAQALDLVQETFVRAFGESARLAYDGLRPYRPYLLRIARNLRIDQLRARQHELPLPSHDSEAIVSELLEASTSAEDDLHFRTLNAATQRYVLQLDAESQRFVDLRFAQELSQADVATQMGATRRRIRTLEELVQTGLKRFLREEGLS